jgi:hypothetical protein
MNRLLLILFLFILSANISFSQSVTHEIVNVDCHGNSTGSIKIFFNDLSFPLYYQVFSEDGTVLTSSIDQWNFNDVVPSENPPPAIGRGTAMLIGGTTNPLTNFSGNGSSDTTSGSNHAWQTVDYPLQGQDSKTAGVQFNVNTLGYKDIKISFDQRLSNSSANTWVLQYTADVTSANPIWIDATIFTFIPQASGTGDTWHNEREFDFAAVSILNDNPNVAFRIVSDFDPVAGEYLAARSTSTYSGGTSRFDMVSITKTPLNSFVELNSLAAGTYYLQLWDSDLNYYFEEYTITEPPAVTAGFTYEIIGQTVYFHNTSSSGSYLWEFGDGNTATVTSPSHNYSASGNITPCLTVFTPCDTVKHCETISSLSISAFGNSRVAKLYPNPAKNKIYLEVLESADNLLVLEILNSVGIIVKRQVIGYGMNEIDLNNISSGVYFYQLSSNQQPILRNKLFITH